jgi:oxygen-independent coproporphyrinogen-3 oxidase
MSAPLAVYVHVPFCPSKCGYCDFNSYAMQGGIVDRTVDAIEVEILRTPWAGRPAKTIFFGGGTPTFLEADQLLRLLNAVRAVHPPLPDCEITSEANPGTVDIPKFGAMRAGGFNRISLGAQSFLDSDLLALERVHKAGDIERAVAAAREAGFDNVNLDLMFALPHQSLVAWRRNLDRALALEPEHLSLYCLTIEPNTAFYKKHLRGQLTLPDDDQQVAMYDECLALTTAAGFHQYEISNFAKPGRECQHNLAYWYAEEYAGYGPGAVGCVRAPSSSALGTPTSQANAERADEEGVGGGEIPVRYTNLKHPKGYCEAVEQAKPLAFESEPLDAATLRTERIMLGLRLNEGLPIRGLTLDPDGLRTVRRRGWVDGSDDRIHLTSEGRHFCSEVALALI